MNQTTKITITYAIIILLLLILYTINKLTAALMIPPIIGALLIITLYKNTTLTLIVIGLIIVAEGGVFHYNTEELLQNAYYYNEIASHVLLLIGIIISIIGILKTGMPILRQRNDREIKFIDYYITQFIGALLGGIFAYGSIQGNMIIPGMIILGAGWVIIGLYIQKRALGKNHIIILTITTATAAYLAVGLSYLLIKIKLIDF